MKYEIIRYNYYHNELSLSLENGADIITEATDSDIRNMEAGKTPTVGNECETWDGMFSCWIDGE